VHEGKGKLQREEWLLLLPAFFFLFYFVLLRRGFTVGSSSLSLPMSWDYSVHVRVRLASESVYLFCPRWPRVAIVQPQGFLTRSQRRACLRPWG
jgi:hypothetical protein